MSTQPIRAACPSCAAAMRIPAHAAGKRVRCPKCQNVFRVPEPAPAPPQAPADDPLLDQDLLSGLARGTAVELPMDVALQRQAAQARAATLTAAQASPASAAPPASARPRARRNVDWVAWIVSFGGSYFTRSPAGYFCSLTLAFGVAGIYVGCNEFQIRGRSKAEPQSITCEQLATHGPGDNLHVLVTDFILLPDYVYETGWTGWKGAWVPAVSYQAYQRQVASALGVSEQEIDSVSEQRLVEALEELKASDFDFRIIVSFPQADGPDYVDRMGEAESIQGMLLEDFTRIEPEGRRLLRQSYPTVKIEDCHILVAGRKPYSVATAQLYLSGGVALLLLSLGMAARRASYETA